MNTDTAEQQSHEYFETYLDAYLDGELDLTKSLEIESHLKNCQACAVYHRNSLTLRSAIRKDPPYFDAPRTLQRRVMSAARVESKEQRTTVSGSWRWLAMATSFALIVVIAFNLRPLFLGRSVNNQIAQEIVSGHVRSLMFSGHTVDVVSSDQHTVKPWFDGKIDFAPPVKDFADKGFALIGGRVDYIGNRTVAVLVYQHQKHFINLYIWPSTDPHSRTTTELQGYNIVNWNSNGMVFWAVSDLNGGELQQFSQLVTE
jgi:anti-sigma factor RsiW